MTLKNSFSDKKNRSAKARDSFFTILKEDRKRRIWPLVIFALLCFLLTAAFELNLESYVGRELAFAKIQDNIERLTQDGIIGIYLIMAGVGACLFGFQGFGWLTKRDQVDFYHSQPMKREKRFKVIYINGILMCFIPMIIHWAVYGLLIAIRGYMNMTILTNLLLNLGIFMIGYLMMYHLVIFAVMISGHLLVSYLLAGILFTYGSIVKYLLEIFYEGYFETFVLQYTNDIMRLGYFSPAEQIYRAGNYLIRGEIGEIPFHLAIVIVMAALFLIGALWLYKKRPSEAAGNALAFPKLGDGIRFAILIPVAMIFGVMFSSVGVMSNLFWLYFGTIVGAVLAHGFMEVIFHFDIKAAIRKKGQLLAGIIFVLCIVNVFYFDIFGYDTYIPKENQVDTVSYYIDIGEYRSYYQALSDDGVPYLDEEYKVVTEAVIEDRITTGYYAKSTGTPTNVSREKYQLRVSQSEHLRPILNVIEAHMADRPAEDADVKRIYMMVCYDMKNGRQVYRQYQINTEVLLAEYQPIYDTEEGKKIIYPYWNLTGEQVQEVYVRTPFMSEKSVELSPEEIRELVQCYKKDILNQSLEELLKIEYLGEVRFVYRKQSDGGTVPLTFHVAKNHKNMIAFFEERDIQLQLPNDNFEVVQVTLYNPYGMSDTVDHPFWQGEDQVTVTREQAEELVPIMVPDEYGYHGYDTNYFLSGDMIVKNKKTGAQQQVHCFVPADKTPEYTRFEEIEIIY